MDPLSPAQLIQRLETLAPPELAAEWDNTGLLLEPASIRPVRQVLLTLDLTPEVTAEALASEVDFIVAYHPPIFSGLKRLTLADPLTRSLLQLLEAGVAVYSPHTALDAAPGGVSDWLCKAVSCAEIEPIEGSGRLITLETALTPQALGEALGRHLNLPYLRHAPGYHGPESIRTLALCPGAGASLLRDVRADAVFTGEMRHHDILALANAGTHVFLSEHSHTERPYLAVFRENLKNLLPDDVRVTLSKTDRDPVQLVPTHA
ncbi:MAG: Nif3-like dinuclear metal center hexameric protein [Verrucomicrobia bacterium]|nr:Nif3-like dinuclear metal center hexameric protein [Verrucomicrobiota bacterium]MCH8512849.1 Nif3-like dinuclear metal center hexameric protein [Kiritimatiellia bacterium]